MMKIANGMCSLNLSNSSLAPLYGVYYKGFQVYVNLYQGFRFGKYVKAYIYSDKNAVRPIAFGEVKFTVGQIIGNSLDGKYVLCEY